MIVLRQFIALPCYHFPAFCRDDFLLRFSIWMSDANHNLATVPELVGIPLNEILVRVGRIKNSLIDYRFTIPKQLWTADGGQQQHRRRHR